MLIEQKDKDFISEKFPGLKFSKKNKKSYLSGKLRFTAKYNFNSGDYEVLDDLPAINDLENVIQDEYEIEINLSVNNIYRSVTEVGGKILKDSSMHISFDGTACVAGYLDEDPNISFYDFICGIVVPFFYDQSYFKKHGIWPRGEFPHGCAGILVNYKRKLDLNLPDDVIIKLTKKCIDILKELNDKNLDPKGWNVINSYLSKGSVKGHWGCVCGKSNLKLCEKCTKECFNGFWLLNENIKYYQIGL